MFDGWAARKDCHHPVAGTPARIAAFQWLGRPQGISLDGGRPGHPRHPGQPGCGRAASGEPLRACKWPASGTRFAPATPSWVSWVSWWSWQGTKHAQRASRLASELPCTIHAQRASRLPSELPCTIHAQRASRLASDYPARKDCRFPVAGPPARNFIGLWAARTPKTPRTARMRQGREWGAASRLQMTSE